MNKILSAAIAASALLAPAAAIADQKPQEYGKPTVINFASHGGIRDWHAVDDRHIYLRDRTNRWYLATLSAPCPGLKFQSRLHFETDSVGRFDTWSSINTRDHSCRVERIVTSPAPDAKGGDRASR